MSENSPAGDVASFSRLLAIVRELRLRCPWDREQTVATVAKHLVEEAYESADAIERDESSAIADELGDLLSQTLFAAVIAEETKRFAVATMFERAAHKLVRRHPHVYGDQKADTAEQVLENWDQIKRHEARAAGNESALDGVARGLPALMRAEKLGQRARRAGMDWIDIHSVLSKIREELDEAEHALARGDHDALAEELGDMMLALANAPRFIDRSAEETLHRACAKFIARFKRIEETAKSRAVDLAQLSPDQLDELWQRAKV